MAMGIAYWVYGISPVLGAVIGYVIDGATGAASGFFVPAGPVVLAWLLDTR
jgi:hypothetical protein